jgi:hypothetical protein
MAFDIALRDGGSSTFDISLSSSSGLVGGVRYWTGSVWVAAPVKYWNGASWVDFELKIYSGGTWNSTLA